MERHNKLNLCHKHAVTVQPHLTFGGQEDGSNGGEGDKRAREHGQGKVGQDLKREKEN